MTALPASMEEALLQVQKAESAERLAKSRCDALQKRADRLESDEAASRARADQIEHELLAVKQQLDKTAREAARAVAEASEMKQAETDAMRQALLETEAKLESVRVLERTRHARVEELESKLALSSQVRRLLFSKALD